MCVVEYPLVSVAVLTVEEKDFKIFLGFFWDA